VTYLGVVLHGEATFRSIPLHIPDEDVIHIPSDEVIHIPSEDSGSHHEMQYECLIVFAALVERKAIAWL
jgi:hypothetical protein